ncbi:RNA-guided endonuclease InsQ/TnpB family protein [Gloeobacter morelensis]|uniref:RNA-guided endonuclease InsQ/TnpB family protein n=1 Tax=Gloeobacter morelensis TaxID=2907343 RepID=UPI001E3A6318|nr:transposase [Gloeobacter morelensis]
MKVSPEQASKMDALLGAFADACNWIHAQVPLTLRNQLKMQALVYHQVRVLFGLSANLAIQAIRRVADARKANRAYQFRPTSIRYDARIFTFRERDWTVSLTMLDGRERFSLALGNYQRRLLAGESPRAAVLSKRQDGTYYVQIVLERAAPTPPPCADVLGVDFGRTDIVHTTKGETFSGKTIQVVRERHHKLRQALQSKAAKGTRVSRRSCRRLLKRLSGRERRFGRHTNHCISKHLVNQAREHSWTIALEALTGIRERTNQQPRSKTERRLANSWSFYQLRQFLEYKALTAGVSVVLVHPAWTSKTCHCCHQMGERQGKSFRCVDGCGWHGDTDLNGARNIRCLGLLVNQPEGSAHPCAYACEWPRSKARPIALCA